MGRTNSASVKALRATRCTLRCTLDLLSRGLRLYAIATSRSSANLGASMLLFTNAIAIVEFFFTSFKKYSAALYRYMVYAAHNPLF